MRKLMKHAAIVLVLILVLAAGNGAVALTGDAAATSAPEAQPTAEPTPAPTAEPTPEPTIDPAKIPAMRSVGEYEVYHTTDGKYYHRSEVCGSMKNGKVHTLSDAVRAGKKTCPYCNPISSDVLEITDPVYVDADGCFHIDFDCKSIEGEFTVIPLAEAIADPEVRPCEDCGAVFYTEGKPELTAADLLPTSDVLITRNGNTIVYYAVNGSVYHSADTCTEVPDKAMYPIRLDDALINGLTPCSACDAPEAEPLD